MDLIHTFSLIPYSRHNSVYEYIQPPGPVRKVFFRRLAPDPVTEWSLGHSDCQHVTASESPITESQAMIELALQGRKFPENPVHRWSLTDDGRLYEWCCFPAPEQGFFRLWGTHQHSFIERGTPDPEWHPVRPDSYPLPRNERWIDEPYAVALIAAATLRPWTLEELPIGGWIKDKGQDGHGRIVGSVAGPSLLVYKLRDMETVAPQIYDLPVRAALKYYQWRPERDSGDWLPCGVPE
jgi:hypothetical protein